MKTLSGTIGCPFDTMVKDTIAVHGLAWAVHYYRVKHGLTALEFRIFSGI